MASNIPVTPGTGLTLKTTETAAVHTPHHNVDVIAAGASVDIGAINETAPASDTAPAGLNGRLQRVAQRLTTLIALLPASLGVKAAASSFAVALSTEDAARLGSVTETAPTTDTASSGLNGRAQRIAQRLTTLLGVVPASLGTKAASASFAVALATEDAAKLTDITLAIAPTSAAAVIGTMNATTTSSAFTPAARRPFNLVLSGTWAGSVFVERQFATGDWYPCTFLGDTVTFTTNVSEVLEETEAAVNYRLNFTRTSGTLAYRFSQ